MFELFNTAGFIANNERDIIIFSLGLMLCVAIPTIILSYIFAWKYRKKGGAKILHGNITENGNLENAGDNGDKEYDGDRTSWKVETILWLIPSLIVLILGFVVWDGAHQLDPYKPLTASAAGSAQPITIDAVALDWKWLFIYPQQGIATVGLMEFPENTPVSVQITAGDAPMNSFWIPQLDGQIYAMSGMVTQMHLIADKTGTFQGKNSEIDGEGFSNMQFKAVSVSENDFNSWVSSVKQSGGPELNDALYEQLDEPSEMSTALYPSISNGIFDDIVAKYMSQRE